MPILLLYTILAAALAGLGLAAWIHFKKRLHEPMVCPVGSRCDVVIHSRYSRIFDVPVELLGILYYTIVVLAYGSFLFFPHLASPLYSGALLALTTAAFCFSLYLTAIQLVVLRELCTWCLTSAALCTVIFFAELKLTGHSLSSFLSLFSLP